MNEDSKWDEQKKEKKRKKKQHLMRPVPFVAQSSKVFIYQYQVVYKVWYEPILPELDQLPYIYVQTLRSCCCTKVYCYSTTGAVASLLWGPRKTGVAVATNQVF